MTIRYRSVRLSIIIPAYNVEQYIGAALDSIFAQEMLPHEVIVVDDGSTDSTAAEITGHPHAAKIRLIKTGNRGQGEARNTGLHEATGDYIYFFDADDLLDARFMASVVARLQANAAADLLLFSGDSFIDGGGESAKKDFMRPFADTGLGGDEAVARLVQAGTPSPSPCLYLFRRSLWQDNGIRFKQVIHEDDEVFVRMVLAASHVVIMRDVLFHRRIRANSTMTSKLSCRNVRGLFAVAMTLTEVYADSTHRPRQTRKAIRKRAIRTAQRYMRVCRKIKSKPDVRQMLCCARVTHSPDLALAAVIHAVVAFVRRTQSC